MRPVVNFCFQFWDTETELILTDSRTGVSSAVPDLRFVEGHQISSQYHLGFFQIYSVRAFNQSQCSTEKLCILLVRCFAPESQKNFNGPGLNV